MFLVETGLDLRAGYAVDVALSMGLANTVEPLVGAALLLRLAGPRPDLSRRDGLTAFIACAVTAGPVVGAVIGSLGPALVAGDAVLPRLPRWFVGDAVGVLVVAPALLALAAPGARAGRGAVLPLVALLAVAVAFVGPFEAPADAGLPFLVIPALAFVAIRVGHVGATVGVLGVAVIVETVSVTGAGPFAHEGPFGGLVVVQMFLVMAALTSLAIGVLMRDVVTRDALAASLREQALHDSLTGLPNRRLLFDRVDGALARLARHEGIVALFYVDLDDFKAVNDERGHVVGDAVLRRTATRLRHTVRDEDTVARIGGDEFVVLAEGFTTVDEIDVLAERLVEACGAPIAFGDAVLDVGASVGVVICDRSTDADTLLGAADRSMYVAKHAGGRRREVAHLTTA